MWETTQRPERWREVPHVASRKATPRRPRRAPKLRPKLVQKVPKKGASGAECFPKSSLVELCFGKVQSEFARLPSIRPTWAELSPRVANLGLKQGSVGQHWRTHWPHSANVGRAWSILDLGAFEGSAPSVLQRSIPGSRAPGTESATKVVRRYSQTWAWCSERWCFDRVLVRPGWGPLQSHWSQNSGPTTPMFVKL